MSSLEKNHGEWETVGKIGQLLFYFSSSFEILFDRLFFLNNKHSFDNHIYF